MKTYNCTRCGYQWTPRSENPLRCPRCKSTRWNKKVIVDKCLRCGAEWVQRGDSEPKYCPTCHSAVWKIPRETYTCPKCGRTRPLRSNSRANLCPVCDRYEDRVRKPSFANYDIRVDGVGEALKIWSDGKGLILMMYENERDNIYLYDDGKLVYSTNLAGWCMHHGIQMGEIVKKRHNERVKSAIGELVSQMIIQSKRYVDTADKIEDLRGVTSEEAACMALHDMGMDPLPISLKLEIPFTTVMEILSAAPPSMSADQLKAQDKDSGRGHIEHHGKTQMVRGDADRSARNVS